VRSKFGVDWFSSFEQLKNLMFPIGTTIGPYHCSATALARDANKTVIITAKHIKIGLSRFTSMSVR